ncbi:MAG: hypothetical protein HOQ11_08420 [Gemmatimonadaceae bacterium]|nr:hypothetical protein [Gemmatimonadaceae bacterium]NUS97418.1 hypothetical protein [Gemmatimonadaceae bacterium]HWI89035.1 hypothetical protein [Sphingomicrobium sp.]
MSERRTIAKLIRFAPGELSAIQERARACGRTPARFIREAALGAIPKPRHRESRDRLLLAFARVGGQLSVLAERADRGGLTEADRAQLAAALEQHRAIVRTLVERGIGPTEGRQRSAS